MQYDSSVHKAAYYEVLDKLCSELDKRFHQETLTFLYDVEQVILSASNGEVRLQLLAALKSAERWRNDLNYGHLAEELATLNSMFAGVMPHIKQYTSVGTVVGAVKMCPEGFHPQV